eukprot:368836_1
MVVFEKKHSGFQKFSNLIGYKENGTVCTYVTILIFLIMSCTIIGLVRCNAAISSEHSQTSGTETSHPITRASGIPPKPPPKHITTPPVILSDDSQSTIPLAPPPKPPVSPSVIPPHASHSGALATPPEPPLDTASSPKSFDIYVDAVVHDMNITKSVNTFHKVQNKAINFMIKKFAREEKLGNLEKD